MLWTRFLKFLGLFTFEVGRLKFEILWYDGWMGYFWDQKRYLYLAPFFWFVFRIDTARRMGCYECFPGKYPMCQRCYSYFLELEDYE